jgi:tetrahydromethanopterin S-methyltransferase subunit F
MGVAIIALAIACVIGWHASKVHMSHGLIPTRKGQLPGLRRDRTHHLIRLFLFAVIIVVILLVVTIH